MLQTWGVVLLWAFLSQAEAIELNCGTFLNDFNLFL